MVRLEKTGNPNDFTLVMYTVNTDTNWPRCERSASNRIFPGAVWRPNKKGLLWRLEQAELHRQHWLPQP